jgi:RNA polymerase sigma-70 factor (ECF subfamily)
VTHALGARTGDAVVRRDTATGASLRLEPRDDGDSDARLVARVLDGDARAFAVLVDRHAAACLRYATRYLGDEQDAEEAVQDGLLRAYRALGSYEPARPFRPWLLTIVTNRCRTTLLHRGRRDRRFVRDETAVLGARAPESPDPGAYEEAIAHALAQLDVPQREAFLLRHVEQLGYDEMAAVTGAGVSALKMRVKRACERLRALLGANDDA